MIELYVKNFRHVWFGVAYQNQGITGMAFSGSEQESIRCLLNGIPYDSPFQIISEPPNSVNEALVAMKTVYEGKDTAEKVQLSMEHLPPYTRRVLNAVLLIPVGYVTSYGAVAKSVGGGARAVGNAMASNPFAPIIPCHRVVSSNFGLGGYSGGLEIKVELLKREKRGYEKFREVQIQNGQLQVFPVEFVLKQLETPKKE
jgi:methylated-DNA-[protein]-cysteine S-methyltransferase